MNRIQNSTFLFDVESLAERIFYSATKQGEPNEPNDFYKGTPVYVLKPLLHLINKEIREVAQLGYNYTHICMVFNHETKMLKGQSQALQDSFNTQVALAVKMLETQGFYCMKVTNVSAVNAIAKITMRQEAASKNTLVFSGDRVLRSCVSEHTQVYYGKAKKLYTKESIIERYGIEPERMVELLAMIGEESRGVKGIKGCGEKTAPQILAVSSFKGFVNFPEQVVDLNVRGIQKIVDFTKSNKEELLEGYKRLMPDKKCELFTSLRQLIRREIVDTNFLELIL